MAKHSILDELRLKYHRGILEKILGLRKKKGEEEGKSYYSNADSGNARSVAIAEWIALNLSATTGHRPCQKPPPEQTAGYVRW